MFPRTNFQKLMVVALLFTGSLSTARNEGKAVRNAKPSTVSPPSAFFAVAPTVAVLDGLVGYGGTLSLHYRTLDNFFLGFEVGTLVWTFPGTLPASDRTFGMIPTLASMTYHLADEGTVRPYLGASAGIVFAAFGVAPIFPSLRGTAGGSGLIFLGYLRPGVEVRLGDSVGLVLEPRVGVIKSGFLFAPQAGLTFSLY